MRRAPPRRDWRSEGSFNCMGFSGLSDDAGGNALSVTRYWGFGYGLNGESWGRPGRIGELRYLMSMETMLADMRLAMVPASMARRPSWARSLRRLGTRAPMPPIWIPMELRFAKPQRAKVVMVKLRGESRLFWAPRLV